MRPRRPILLVVLAATLGCPSQDESGPTRVVREQDGPPPKPAVAEPSGDEPAPPVEQLMPTGLVLGPARDAHGTSRSDAVLTLLSDGMLASRLPVVASDPGVEFDPHLVEQLAPGAIPLELSPP